MKKNHVLWMFILLPWMTHAQLTESFTDGNFTTDPEWQGDTQEFKVNTTHQLQLSSSGENTSSLATRIIISDSMEWNFWVKLSFSPSDNNFTRIYLVSDQQNLEVPLNGYFIKLGESGSNDAIELFRQTGSEVESLCKGTAGLISASFSIRIKIIRFPEGSWQLFADPSGGNDYKLEASAHESSFYTGNWFGVSCKYTSSNSTKFYFDDIYAGTVVLDQMAPELISVKMAASSNLLLEFSESVDSTSACIISNYFVDQQIGTPQQAWRDSNDHTKVNLLFSTAFLPDISYTLKTSNIKDLAGNSIVPVQFPFGFHPLHSFDVLINEIMCDPNTAPGMPNLEFIELYNRSAFNIDMDGWCLSIGNTKKYLPPFLLIAGGYALICADEALPYLEPFGSVITFPSISLANSGAMLTLSNACGAIVHSVFYTDEWYRSDFKKEGGWSLELIDPSNPCGDAGNWMASVDPGGCTPGRANSVKSSNPDHQLPRIVRVGVIDPLNLEVTFSESLDSTTLTEVSYFSIDNEIGIPVSISSVRPGFKKIQLELGAPILKNKTYTLTISGPLTDCAGNQILLNNSGRFAIPEKAEQSDLIINELLFDPVEGCIDFIEIYNRSSKVLDLKNFTLCSYDTISKSLIDISEISKESMLVFPGEYFVFSTDTCQLRKCHPLSGLSIASAFSVQMLKIPPMNNDAGSIGIALSTGEIIDHMSYSVNMQYPLLRSPEGVSLERISPDRPSMDLLNWHSAAENAGYATPAAKNSQFGIVVNDGHEISLSPEIFSPDNDGQNDCLNIEYSFSTSGYNSSVTIFDISGHLIRNLITNELCGTSGTWSWDGINNSREKAPIGRYIVFVEVFDLQGNVRKFKKVTILGGYL